MPWDDNRLIKISLKQKNRLMINDDGNGLMESPHENLYLENPDGINESTLSKSQY
jgi:hypothetical protein